METFRTIKTLFIILSFQTLSRIVMDECGGSAGSKYVYTMCATLMSDVTSCDFTDDNVFHVLLRQFSLRS